MNYPSDDDHDTHDDYLDRQVEEEGWYGAWCAQCGPDTAVDEDGACASCGADSLGDGAQQAHAWRKLAQDMGEFLSGACPDALAWEGDGGLAERLDALEFQGRGGGKS